MQNEPNFQNAQNGRNLSKANELQRTMNYELLFKTNPIKPNFIRLRRVYPPLRLAEICENLCNLWLDFI